MLEISMFPFLPESSYCVISIIQLYLFLNPLRQLPVDCFRYIVITSVDLGTGLVLGLASWEVSYQVGPDDHLLREAEHSQPSSLQSTVEDVARVRHHVLSLEYPGREF